jgi:hypothetical protein
MIAFAQQDCILVENVRMPLASAPFDKFTKFRLVSADD